MNNEELEHIAKKKLLLLLGELNDAEIIWLKYYSYLTHPQNSESKKFYKNHEDILHPEEVSFGSNEEGLDRDAIKKSYVNNLLRLGLIDSKENPVKSYYCTRLGTMLLRYIDFEVSEED